jgi:hypothetical protein
MIKFLLYFAVLTAFIPLTSSGKIKLLSLRHVSETRNMRVAREVVSVDEGGLMIPFVPFQDSLNGGGRKRIKEVGRSKPQAIPEKVDRNNPDDRPADNPDRGNARPPIERPSSERTNVRQGGRPQGGMPPGGARPQPPPPRPGR